MRYTRPGAGGWSKLAAAIVVVAATGLQVSSATAAVATLYVGGAGCTDTGQGTQGQPFCSISKAASIVVAGQTVIVADGSYPETVSVTKSGTASAPIDFTAAQGATPTLTGGSHGFSLSNVSYVTVNGFTVTNTSSSGIYVSKSTFVTISQDHVSYSGLPTPGATAAGIQVNGGSDSLIARNTVDHNTVAGIYLTNGSTRITVDENLASWNAFGYVRNAPGIDVRTAGNTVLRNISHDNEDSGLQFYPGANDNLVAGNVSYHNKGFTEVQLTNCNHPKTGDTGGCITGDHGIDDLNVTGNTLIGNSIYDNVSAGINVEGTSGNFLIANNVSVDNAINCPNGAGGTEKCPRTAGNIRVDQDSTVGTTLHQDLVYLHLAAGQTGTMMTWKTSGYATLAAFETVSGQEQSGLEADPLWLAPGAGNLRLAAGSPAIDSADSAVGGELTSDIDGTPRTDDPATPNTGAGPRTYDDRGAYEFGAGPATVPGAPVAVASADTSSVQLSWTAPADGGSPITGYDLYRATTPGGEGATPVAQLGVVSSYQDSAVASGTTYYYQVTALNSVGEGARSAEVSATPTAAATVPGAPVAVASAGTSSVQVSWTAPADGGSPIIGYDVYRATTPGGEGATPVAQLGVVSSYQDSAVASGT
ncbi:MAG: hypothetical protein QOG69_1963, partial [Actinomycetota bacterium]|nr:hypothetical protein [Actinomycetota bacterium]